MVSNAESADGTRIAYERRGSGAPVVLVHGSGGGLHSWAAVADRLVADFEVWTPVRRGYDPSDAPPGVKSFADDVADLAAVTAGPVHLVGASYGATVALHAAVALPHRVRSLTVFEAPLFAAGPAVAPPLGRYRAALGRDDTAAMAAALNEVTRVPAAVVAAFGAPDPAAVRRSAVGWLHDLEALAGDSTDITRWAAVTAPTLVLRGTDTWDPMPTVMDELARVVPGAHRVVWEGQSHFATMTAPDLFADTVRGFLTGR